MFVEGKKALTAIRKLGVKGGIICVKSSSRSQWIFLTIGEVRKLLSVYFESDASLA